MGACGFEVELLGGVGGFACFGVFYCTTFVCFTLDTGLLRIQTRLWCGVLTKVHETDETSGDFIDL